MVKQITVRMNYNSLKRIMKVYPPYKNEKMSAYFNRIAVLLEKKKEEGVLK